MSGMVNFEDLSPAEQAAVLARGRAQFAPLRTPTVEALTDAGNPLPKPSPSTLESMAQAATKAMKAAHDYVASGIKAIDTVGGLMPGTPKGSFVTPQSVNPVPGTLMEAGSQLLMGKGAATKPLSQALVRIGGGAVGGEIGGRLEGRKPGEGAQFGGGSALLGEVGGGVVGAGARMMPGAKSMISERRGQAVRDVAETISPGAAESIEGARATLRPLKGGNTAAALQEWALGGGGQAHASKNMGAAVAKIEQALGNPLIEGTALKRAYEMMPQLAKDELVGEVASGGFTIRQAQAVRSWLGSGAFGQSPLGQGVGQLPQQQLWSKTTQEIESSLGPELKKFQDANKEYGGLQVLLETLQGPRAFQSLPNRILLNTPALADTLSTNRQDFSRRMGGRPEFDTLTNAMLAGGQVGTRDVLAPGAGGAMDALRQVYGRGQGGAPQILGSMLRTAAPNIGSEYTGRERFMSLDNAPQAFLNLLLNQRGVGMWGGQ